MAIEKINILPNVKQGINPSNIIIPSNYRPANSFQMHLAVNQELRAQDTMAITKERFALEKFKSREKIIDSATNFSNISGASGKAGAGGLKGHTAFSKRVMEDFGENQATFLESIQGLSLDDLQDAKLKFQASLARNQEYATAIRQDAAIDRILSMGAKAKPGEIDSIAYEDMLSTLRNVDPADGRVILGNGVKMSIDEFLATNAKNLIPFDEETFENETAELYEGVDSVSYEERDGITAEFKDRTFLKPEERQAGLAARIAVDDAAMRHYRRIYGQNVTPEQIAQKIDEVRGATAVNRQIAIESIKTENDLIAENQTIEINKLNIETAKLKLKEQLEGNNSLNIDSLADAELQIILSDAENSGKSLRQAYLDFERAKVAAKATNSGSDVTTDFVSENFTGSGAYKGSHTTPNGFEITKAFLDANEMVISTSGYLLADSIDKLKDLGYKKDQINEVSGQYQVRITDDINPSNVNKGQSLKVPLAPDDIPSFRDMIEGTAVKDSTNASVDTTPPEDIKKIEDQIDLKDNSKVDNLSISKYFSYDKPIAELKPGIKEKYDNFLLSHEDKINLKIQGQRGDKAAAQTYKIAKKANDLVRERIKLLSRLKANYKRLNKESAIKRLTEIERILDSGDLDFK